MDLQLAAVALDGLGEGRFVGQLLSGHACVTGTWRKTHHAYSLPLVAALARFVTGRKTKFVVIVAWLLVAAAASPLAAKLPGATTDDFASVLPADAESTQVQRLLEQRFPGGDTANGLIVYRRPGGLTADDQAKIQRDAQLVAGKIPVVAPPIVPFASGAPAGLVSPDRDAAYTVVVVPQDFEQGGRVGHGRARDRPRRTSRPGSRRTSAARSASARTSRRSSATSTARS